MKKRRAYEIIQIENGYLVYSTGEEGKIGPYAFKSLTAAIVWLAKLFKDSILIKDLSDLVQGKHNGTNRFRTDCIRRRGR